MCKTDKRYSSLFTPALYRSTHFISCSFHAVCHLLGHLCIFELWDVDWIVYLSMRNLVFKSFSVVFPFEFFGYLLVLFISVVNKWPFLLFLSLSVCSLTGGDRSPFSSDTAVKSGCFQWVKSPFCHLWLSLIKLTSQCMSGIIPPHLSRFKCQFDFHCLK